MTDNGHSLEEMIDRARHTVESIGKSFTKPDDDWDQMAFLEDAQGDTTVMALMVENSEQAATAIIRGMLDAKAERIVLIQSVWTWTGKTGERPTINGHRVEVKDMPDRGEAVTLMSASKDGVMRCEQAEIVRHEDGPPTLGPWVTKPDVVEYKGTFPTAIRIGFGPKE